MILDPPFTPSLLNPLYPVGQVALDALSAYAIPLMSSIGRDTVVARSAWLSTRSGRLYGPSE